MPITIIQPALVKEPVYNNYGSDEETDSDGGVDLEGDVSMGGPTKRARRGESIVTPGEVITEDPQWMR